MDKRFIPRRLATLLCGAALLCGCQTAPTTVGTVAPAAAPLPELPVAGAAHYRIDAARSDVRFLAYRAGPLASFGHNHVIQAKELGGDVYVAKDLDASGFSLVLKVAGFVVDAPEARAVEGPDFAKQPAAADIEGTRKNMLGPGLLDAGHYPEVRIRSVKFLGPDWGLDATVRIELHGVARDLTVPIAVARDGTTLAVTGAFDLKQSDFGLKPFSILGGGLQVADALRVRFHLVAQQSP